MSSSPTESSSDPFDSAVNDAARRFFSTRPETRAADALGLTDVLVECATDGERALHLAAVGIEAGSAQYTGSLAEDCLVALSGVKLVGHPVADYKVATLRTNRLPVTSPNSVIQSPGVTLQAGAPLKLSGHLCSLPYLSDAKTLLLLTSDRDVPSLVQIDLRGAYRRADAERALEPEYSQELTANSHQHPLALFTRMQLDGSDLSDVWFQKHPVQESEVLARGESAERLVLKLSQFACLTTAARLVGCAFRALSLTREHLTLREQFGRPLASFQALQHSLASLFVDIRVCRSFLAQLALSWDDEEDRRGMLLNALKSKASQVAMAAAKTAVQMHGATGYCDEHEVGSLLKHVMVLSARDGTSAEHRRAFSQTNPPLFQISG